MLELLGMAYSGSGDHEQVLKIYEQLKGISPSSADSFLSKVRAAIEFMFQIAFDLVPN